MQLKESGEQPPVLAFDIGGTRIKAGVVRGDQALAFHSEPLDRQERAADFVRTLLRIGQGLCEQQRVEAVGISIKGIVDAQRGSVVEVKEALIGLVGWPLATELERVFGLPVAMENDARMYTLGELTYGAGRTAENLVCLTLGTGVGCGVAINRRVLRGRRGLSGFLGGHISVQADGPRCNCGNIGCLEAFIGTTAFLEEAQRQAASHPRSALAGIQQLTPREIFRAAAAGDEPAQALVERFTHYLSVGVVSLIHAYGPDLVVLGGGIMGAAAQILPAVQQYVAQHTWTLLGQEVRVVGAALGDSAALLGAGAFALGAAALMC